MSDLSRLEGIGPKRIKLLNEAGINTLRDLVYHLPRRYIDRTKFTPISELQVGKDAIFPAKVISLSIIQTRMILEVEDETGTLELLFFRGIEYLRNRFFEGQSLLIAGIPTFFREMQIVHPEWEKFEPGQPYIGSILPRYPLTVNMAAARMEHKLLQKVCLQALQEFSLSDGILEKDRDSLKLKSENDLLKLLHDPKTMEEIPDLRRQLKIRELLPLSIRLEASKRARAKVGRGWPTSKSLYHSLIETLPFKLTAGQKDVIAELSKGQAGMGQYACLLQGDVGSGKTVVALFAAANVLEAGGQVVFMAPTEILATQHFQTLSPWLKTLGIPLALLMGETAKDQREKILSDLASGELNFLIGTHAVYSKDVHFKNLGLAIIDEQHRFGVEQRQALAAKGSHSDLIYLSATPIPRTLAQTVFGDMDNLVLKEKPAGRLPVKTRLVPFEKRRDMLGFLLKEIQSGNQVFWVVPQIGKSEEGNKSGKNSSKKNGKDIETEDDLDIILPSSITVQKAMGKSSGDGIDKKSQEDIATLEKVEKEIRAFSKDWKIGIVHGRLTADQKAQALAAFRKGELHLLLATTVIEVGVDVPNANLMVIEGPDRFGLAQLHQLRGRTGRGSQQAWCFLAMPEKQWAEETLERLQGFVETEDGFEIAEMDLRSRGTGNLEGTDQSGFDGLRFTNLIEDFALTQEMRRYAAVRGE